MYAREIEGQTLTFGVSGKLIMNALVMYDHQTESLWSQFLGQAVKGEFIGTKLAFIPAFITKWSTWVGLHPDTAVLDKGPRFARDPYISYYRSGAAGVLGETLKDGRLPTKEFVIGLENDDEAVAYPYRLLDETPVINDTFQGVPIVVALDPESGTGVVFRREVGETLLTFEVADVQDEGPFVMVDRETDSKWIALTGEAVQGAFVGTTLERFRSYQSFWFSWKDYYPHTRVYGQ